MDDDNIIYYITLTDPEIIEIKGCIESILDGHPLTRKGTAIDPTELLERAQAYATGEPYKPDDSVQISSWLINPSKEDGYDVADGTILLYYETPNKGVLSNLVKVLFGESIHEEGESGLLLMIRDDAGSEETDIVIRGNF